jgi:hypothetical protein
VRVPYNASITKLEIQNGETILTATLPAMSGAVRPDGVQMAPKE